MPGRITTLMLCLMDGRTRPLLRKVRLLALRELLRQQTALQAVLMGEPRGALQAMDEVVLPLLLCWMAGARSAEAMLARALPELMARLQTRETLTLEAPIRVLHQGGQRAEVDASAMLLSPSGPELLIAGRPVPLDQLDWRPDRHGLLALSDDFPLSLEEAHPDKQGNAFDLGARPVQAWTEALDAALALIEQGLPGWSQEGPLARVVPVGFEPERHLSASYREAPGLVWMTLHPQPAVMAEALVHENQHSRLNLLSWLDPVLHNAWSEWTESPVRPDLRPLMGVLLAVHAFVPVAVMHRNLGRDEDRRRVWASNERGLAVLREKARPTPLGARLLAALEEHHAATAG